MRRDNRPAARPNATLREHCSTRGNLKTGRESAYLLLLVKIRTPRRIRIGKVISTAELSNFPETTNLSGNVNLRNNGHKWPGTINA